MNKRVDMSQLLDSEEDNASPEIDDLDLDLGARMKSAADVPTKPKEEDIPDMSVVSPFHMTNYPKAYKVRFEKLKKIGAVRGSHSAFVQAAVEHSLMELEEKYSSKLK